MNISISGVEKSPPWDVDDLRTPYDILRLLRQKAQSFGFKHFIVLKLPVVGEARIGAMAVLSNWPAELSKAYDARCFGASSPILRRLSKSAICFQYCIGELYAKATDQQDVIALFNRYGMARFAYFPVHNPASGFGAIGFSGTREVLEPKEMSTLQMISIGLFDRLVHLQAGRDEAMPRLTVRERECLLWTAEGKTSFEIGKIIGISEHTVNYYLNTASGKLNSSNRVQAVAMALRNGLIG